MKKLAILMAAAALLFVGCKPNVEEDDKAGQTEVGLWYGYNTPDSKDDVAYVLELKKDGTADFIISAWGCRWQGTYTYDGKVVKLTWKKYLYRPNAMDYIEAYNDYPTLPQNLYLHWEDGTTSEDANQYGAVIEIKFTYSGDTGEIDMFNKPCVAERQK